MIKLINVDKYFNKGKQNSIHVINNTSLELPEKGLVTLLGQSGSGKSTLLNVISGLDKANGTILFKDLEINKYKSNIWDSIRAEKIGFIFQNYHLLENKTIYENIADVLKMIGISDKEEVEYRVNYVLEAVGMFRFRKKLASDLSGGQKQRVAIARAIVKNPDVIIADEPTGNLDSKNSIDILKIIKEISKEKLVVLVTHNIELANHYSDRIINMKDGLIESDINNESGTSQLTQLDDNLYLKDYKNSKQDNIDIYSNDDVADFGLIVVKENGKYYIKAKNNIKLEVLENTSKIKMIDRNREEVLKESLEKNNFSISELEKHQTKRTKVRSFSIKDSIKQGFNKISKKGFKRFIKITTLLLIGAMFALGVNMIATGLTVDKSKITVDKNVYKVENSSNLDIYEEYGKSDDYILYNQPDSITIALGNNRGVDARISTLPLEVLVDVNKDNVNDVYIDKLVLKGTTAEKAIYKSLGIYKESDLIGKKIIIGSSKYYYDNEDSQTEPTTYVIKGVVDRGSKSIYISKDIIKTATKFNKYDDYQKYDSSKYKIVEGNIDGNIVNKEIKVLISDWINHEYEIGDVYMRTRNGYRLIVSGYYEGTEDTHTRMIFFDEKIYKDLNFITPELNRNAGMIYIYSKNGNDISIEGAISNDYESRLESLAFERELFIEGSIIWIGIIVAITLIMFYFFVRSSLTERMKEISILRALGVKKKEVRSIFIIEYAILTTFSSLIGVLITIFILKGVYNSSVGQVLDYNAPFLGIVISIIGIYALNILIALIPVNLFLRKTPAQMLTNYDI